MKLNLGCGKRNFGSEWIHIDGGNFDHLHSHDIINLPFDNDSVDIIYSSHVIEYFDREEINIVLKKWYKKLKPQGILRLAVPNFEVLSKLYSEKKVSLSQIVGPLYGKIKMGGSIIYHKTVYDFVELKNVLELNGFFNVREYRWQETEHASFDDHSQAYLPHMDKDNGVLISLNVECNK